MLLLRGEAGFAQQGWKDAMNVSLQAHMRRFMKSYRLTYHHVFFFIRVKLLDLSRSSSLLWRKSGSIFRDQGHQRAIRKMKPSRLVALVSRRMWAKQARFVPSKAADSHQAATQSKETQAGNLTAWQHMLKGSEASRGRMLLSAVVELSVRPGHQAVTASVCSAQILRYLV